MGHLIKVNGKWILPFRCDAGGDKELSSKTKRALSKIIWSSCIVVNLCIGNSDKDLQKVIKELVQESLSTKIQCFKEATANKGTGSAVEGKT